MTPFLIIVKHIFKKNAIFFDFFIIWNCFILYNLRYTISCTAVIYCSPPPVMFNAIARCLQDLTGLLFENQKFLCVNSAGKHCFFKITGYL